MVQASPWQLPASVPESRAPPDEEPDDEAEPDAEPEDEADPEDEAEPDEEVEPDDDAAEEDAPDVDEALEPEEGPDDPSSTPLDAPADELEADEPPDSGVSLPSVSLASSQGSERPSAARHPVALVLRQAITRLTTSGTREVRDRLTTCLAARTLRRHARRWARPRRGPS